jgi:threonine synthase
VELAGTASSPVRALADLSAVLPLPAAPVTLGEAGTPLLALDRVAPAGSLFGKAEWCNPTGSFKDRGAAVAMSWARRLGAERVVAASTGNNAASVAAYSARAGLPCALLVPHTTTDAKLAQAVAAAAEVLEVTGTFSDCHRLATALADTDAACANLTSTYASPFMTEAHKSIAYEVVDALGGAPGSIVIPLGAGPMLAGIIKGFEELLASGRVTRVPVPVGVQAAACAPIVSAFDAGAAEVTAWEGAVHTTAASIADPLVGYAHHGTRTLRLLRRHGGVAVAVDENAIVAALRDLGAGEGVVCEPAAASTLAAVRSLGHLPSPCVLVLSGHGLKDPGALVAAARQPRRRVQPDVPLPELRVMIGGA